jgi:hypothetical protein
MNISLSADTRHGRYRLAAEMHFLDTGQTEMSRSAAGQSLKGNGKLVSASHGEDACGNASSERIVINTIALGAPRHRKR